MNPSDAQMQWLIDHKHFDHDFLQVISKQLQSHPSFDLLAALVHHRRLSAEQAESIRHQINQGKPLPIANKLSPLPLQVPGYKVSRELGRGGMGVVYLGEQDGTGAEVVIKSLLKDEPSIELISRFHREARVLAQFSHKNIVAIKDFGTQSGQPYMVMNRISGQDLKHCVENKLKEKHALPLLNWVLPIMIEVAEGLAACHEKGIVHRDLKPENIMIEENGKTPIIIDFGLAQVGNDSKSSTILEDLGNQLTKTGEVLGTPAYMAPEQLDVEDKTSVNEKADVWGFGATLFFCLTGRAPYVGNSPYSIYKQLLETVPPPPSSANSDVPPWLDKLCQEMMTRSSHARPTMNEVFLRLKEGAPKSKIVKKTLAFLSVLAIVVSSALGVSIALKDETNPSQPLLINSGKIVQFQENDQTVLYTKKSSITLRFQSVDDNPDRIEARNNRDKRSKSVGKHRKSGYFKIKIPLLVGKNEVQVSAIDKQGNLSVPFALTIYRSSLILRITKFQPPEKLQVVSQNAFRFQVSGSLNQNGCRVSFHGKDAEMTGRGFAQEIEFKGKKSTPLTLTLTDPYGEETLHSIPIAIVGQNSNVPRTHKNISSAVNSARAGARIFLLPGRYINKLKINKSIELFGIGDDVEISPTRGVPLEILDNISIHFYNLQLTRPEKSREDLITQKAGQLTLENCVLQSGSQAIIHCGSLEKTGDPKPKLTLKDCVIRRKSYFGVVAQNAELFITGCAFTDNRRDGLPNSRRPEEKDMSVYSRRATVMVGSDARLTLTDSTFEIVKDRHVFVTGSYAKIENCQFKKSYQEGIYYGWKSTGDVKNIHCVEPTQESLVGINFTRLTIEDSSFQRGGIGYIDTQVGTETSRRSPALDFASNGKATIQRCLFKDNKGHGLRIQEDATDLKVTVLDSKFLANDRGGILQTSGQLVLKNTVIANNNGHGLHVQSATAFCQDCDVTKNRKDGIYASKKSEVLLLRVAYSGNGRDRASRDQSSNIKVLKQ